MVKIKIAAFQSPPLDGEYLPTLPIPPLPSPCHLCHIPRTGNRSRAVKQKRGLTSLRNSWQVRTESSVSEISLGNIHLETSAFSFPKEFCVGCWGFSSSCHCKCCLAGARSPGGPDVFLKIFKNEPAPLHFSSSFLPKYSARNENLAQPISQT